MEGAPSLPVMLALLLVIATGLIVWQLSTPGTKFARRFRALLERPVDSTHSLCTYLIRKLPFEDGWMKATWMPITPFLFFPGRFDEERWRNVPRAMHTIVVSLERSASTAGRG